MRLQETGHRVGGPACIYKDQVCTSHTCLLGHLWNQTPGEVTEGLLQKCLTVHQACSYKPQIPQVWLSSMGLPKKAKGGSKNKSKGGKEKDCKPRSP